MSEREEQPPRSNMRADDAIRLRPDFRRKFSN